MTGSDSCWRRRSWRWRGIAISNGDLKGAAHLNWGSRPIANLEPGRRGSSVRRHTCQQPCDSHNFARPAFNEIMPVAAARWLCSSARRTHARPSLRNHDPFPTAHAITISISLPAGSLQRDGHQREEFGDEEDSLTSNNKESLLTHIIIIVNTYENWPDRGAP